MATYWGYRNLEDITSNMSAFRAGKFPVDTFIADYGMSATTRPHATTDASPRNQSTPLARI